MNTEHGEIIIYKTPDGKTSLEVQLEKETVWLTQKQLSDLFGSERSVITKHINNIFKSLELEKNSASAKFAHTASDGKNNRGGHDLQEKNQEKPGSVPGFYR